MYNMNNNKQDHYDAWKAKPLHGQFARETDGCIDVSQQWKWLSNLKKNRRPHNGSTESSY